MILCHQSTRYSFSSSEKSLISELTTRFRNITPEKQKLTSTLIFQKRTLLLTSSNVALQKGEMLKWLEQLRRDERLIPEKLENLYVCNEHFTDDCFKTEFRFELLGGNTRRRSLKKDAFPTIFQRKPLVKAEERKEVSYETSVFKTIFVGQNCH